MQLYCLDNSDASCRSEDYPCGNRLAWQLTVIRTISRSLLAPQDCQDSDSAAVNRSKRSLAVVASAGRPALSVAPTNDAAALLGLDLACHDGERCQFLGGLRLALLAAKRSVNARVLAFLASQADLPSEQCRQLSASFSTAGVPLDVVLLCPDGELPADYLTALELLTAVSVYEKQPSSASGSKQAAHRPRSSEQQQRSAAGAATTSASAAMGPSGSATAAAGPPAGQRLVHFPPPDPSLAVWQQLELLLEQLQLDRPAQQGGQPGAGSEDERPAATAHRAQSTSAASGRPPLPRPGRQRGLPGATAASAPLAAAASAAAAAQTLRSGLVPTGPLPSRSAARRGITSGNCRYESLDSLQHLSLDGFLRSWLPSYANVSRVMPVTQPQQPQLQRQSPDGNSGAGEAGGGALAEVSAGGAAGPVRLCYISIYRLQLPQWHKLLEVKAGCMYESQLPSGTTPGGLHGEEPSTPSPGSGVGQAVGPPPACRPEDKDAEEGGTDAAASTSTGTGSGAKMLALQPPSRPLVPRAPCPVQVSFSTRCSSAAAATSASSLDHATSLPSNWVCPDSRRGCLSLIASVEDPGVVKLLWSERQRSNPEAAQQYGSIFAAAEDSLGDGGVDPAAAELEITLSPTQSQFRVVPNVRGGAVLEVIAPRTAIHRRHTEGGAPSSTGGSSSTGPPAEVAGPASSPPSADTTARGGAASPRMGRDSIAPWSSQQNLLQHHTPQPLHRYFFWLQQDWPAGAAVDAADEMLAATSSGCPMAAPAASGASRRWDCAALVDQLQALLECPPEFDPHKHGGRVRCSSTPLQLGPLPFALVEEIMRASGRQLSPDGTITHLARSAASPSTTLAAAASTAVMSFAAPQQQRAGPRPSSARARAIPSVSSATSVYSGGAAEGQRTEGTAGAATATTAADAAAGGLKRGTSGQETAADRSPFHALPTSRTAVGGVIANSLVTPDRRDVVSGFRRVTYSKVVLPPHAKMPPGAACGPERAGEAPAGAAEASGGATLASHPLEELDWDSESEDNDSQAAGSSHAGSASETPQPSSPRGGGLCAHQAAPAGADVSPSSVSGVETVPTPRPTCLAGECARSGFAAAAAAAAATAGSASAPLVAATVDPDGGGSCQEESSLMFELD